VILVNSLNHIKLSVKYTYLLQVRMQHHFKVKFVALKCFTTKML